MLISEYIILSAVSRIPHGGNELVHPREEPESPLACMYVCNVADQQTQP